MNHPKKFIDHAQPEMNGGIDQFLAAGDRLKSDPTFTKGYEKLAKEGANMMVAMADIKRVTIPKANPFLTGERQEADQTDAILHAVHEYFLLDEEAKAKPSAHDLEEATFHPSSGVFGRLLIMLAEDEDYSRSYQALKLIEGEFRSMFDVPEPTLALAETEPPTTEIVQWNQILTRRKKLLLILYFAYYVVFQTKKTRELLENLLHNIPAQEPKTSSTEPPSTNQELGLVSKAVGGNLSDDERKKLQQMYVEMAPIKQMVGAFQRILAQDMMEKRKKDPDDKRTQKLLPLLTAEGFTQCMAVAESKEGEAIPSLFSALPEAFEDYCADLEIVEGFTPTPEKEAKKIDGYIHIGKHIVGRPEKEVSYGVNPHAFLVNGELGTKNLKFRIERYIIVNNSVVFFEDHTGFSIKKFEINKHYRGGDIVKIPYIDCEDSTLYNKPFNDWYLGPEDTLVVKIGGSYYRVKSNQVDGKKVFVE